VRGVLGSTVTYWSYQAWLLASVVAVFGELSSFALFAMSFQGPFAVPVSLR
jgi:hypothetical protein